jgi:hypothetical protein
MKADIKYVMRTVETTNSRKIVFVKPEKRNNLVDSDVDGRILSD